MKRSLVTVAVVTALALVATIAHAQARTAPERVQAPVGPAVAPAGAPAAAPAAAPRAAAAAMECPRDMPHCNRSARGHHRAFKRGDYGRAVRHVHYGKRLKRRILRAARPVWNRKYDRPYRPKRVWRHFYNDGDTCIRSSYGSVDPYCRAQHRMPRATRVRIKNIAACAGTIAITLIGRGAGRKIIQALGGGLLCHWVQTDDDFR
jgi:hypothetical protein